MPYKHPEDANRSNRESYSRKILNKLGESSWEEHVDNIKKRKEARIKNLPNYNKKKHEELMDDPIRLMEKRQKGREYYWRVVRGGGERIRKSRNMDENQIIVKGEPSEYINQDLIDSL